MKRIFVHLIIITSIISSCLTCPVFGARFAYAASGDITSGIAKANMVDAFKAYCKSRDMTIDGSVLDAVDNFTSQTFEDICDTLGIDMTALQAQIQKVVDPDSNVIKYFIFTSFGINGFNRIFAQLLQDNDLAVGDEDVDKVIYSGEWWEDDNGKGCFVFKVNKNRPSGSSVFSYSNQYSLITEYGNFIYTGEQLASLCSLNNFHNLSFKVNGETISGNMDQISRKSNGLGYCCVPGTNENVLSAYDMYWAFYYNSTKNTGGCTVVKFKDGKYGLGMVGLDCGWGSYDTTKWNYALYCLENTSSHQTDVKIVSPTIKPALPETPTSIAPDGRTSPDDQNPTEPLPDPIGGTPPDWSTDTDIVPDGDGWNIPFSLPDLDIDWSIQGLTNKFPFCIPFDLVNLIQVLDVNPRAPQIQGTINLLVYEWEVDMDFERFDEVAEIFRNLVYIGFVLGLIIITRRLIKG